MNCALSPLPNATQINNKTAANAKIASARPLLLFIQTDQLLYLRIKLDAARKGGTEIPFQNIHTTLYEC